MIDEIVILAAGVGSRMAEITHDRPKCMAPFLNGTILSRLLRQLEPFQPRAVHIVGGYRIDVLRTYLASGNFALPVNLLENVRYAETNSLVSAEIALEKARGQVLMFNSDVVYENELVSRMVMFSAPWAFSLDRSDYNEESEKLALDGSGRVSQIAKTIAELDATGCSADFYRLQAGNGGLLELVRRYRTRPDSAKRLFEDFLDQLLLTERFEAVDITGLEWYEIDTAEELKDAEEVFTNVERSVAVGEAR